MLTHACPLPPVLPPTSCLYTYVCAHARTHSRSHCALTSTGLTSQSQASGAKRQGSPSDRGGRRQGETGASLGPGSLQGAADDAGWRLQRALAARVRCGYTPACASSPRHSSALRGPRRVRAWVGAGTADPSRLPWAHARCVSLLPFINPPGLPLPDLASLDLFLPSLFLGFNLKGGERECGPQLSSGFCARHRWKTITELFGNSLGPGSVVETWTQRPETRPRRTTRRGCPWGLID